MNINSHKKLLLIFWHISSVFFLCVYLKRKNYPQLWDISFQDIVSKIYLIPPTIQIYSSNLQRKFLLWVEWVFSYLRFII